MIISISGRSGHGKDTVGQIIQYLQLKHQYKNVFGDWTFEKYLNYGTNEGQHTWQSDWEIKKFAGKLKEIVCIITGCTLYDLESQEFKDKVLPKEWWTYNHLSHPDFKSSKRPISDLSEEDFIMFEKHGRITKPTYRSLLQQIGTEGMRDIIGENVWVNSLFSEYKDIRNNKEIGLIHKRGTSVRSVSDPKKFIVPYSSLYPERLHGTEIPDGGRFEYIEEAKLPVHPNWIITDTRFNELKAVKYRGGLTIQVKRKLINNFMEVDQEKMTIRPYPEHPSETSLDNSEFDEVIINDSSIDDLILKVKQILIKHNLLK